MKIHDLKIKYEYFIDVLLGIKTFELRKNDRNFKVGDLIAFKIVDNPENAKNLKYVNRFYRIIYILKDVQEYGLDKDYCILGIQKSSSNKRPKKQYCRYCAYCTYGDAVYCEMKDKVMNIEAAKRLNKCPYFAFNERDVFNLNHKYKPKKRKKKLVEKVKLF